MNQVITNTADWTGPLSNTNQPVERLRKHPTQCARNARRTGQHVAFFLVAITVFAKLAGVTWSIHGRQRDINQPVVTYVFYPLRAFARSCLNKKIYHILSLFQKKIALKRAEGGHSLWPQTGGRNLPPSIRKNTGLFKKKPLIFLLTRKPSPFPRNKNEGSFKKVWKMSYHQANTMQNRPANPQMSSQDIYGPGGHASQFPDMVSGHSEKFFWEDFLGPPNNGLQAPPPIDSRQHSIEDMPAAYRGKNAFLEHRLRRLEIMMGDFTGILAPSVTVDDISFTWSEITFNAHTADITPYQSAPRLVTYGEKHFRAILPRRGIAMRMEHNFMLTDKGRMIFYQQIISMAEAVTNVIKLEVLRAIRMTHDYPPEGYNASGEFNGTNALDHQSIVQLMQDSISQFYCLMHPGMLVDLITRAKNDIARRKGDQPDTILAPEILQTALMHYDIERTTYKGAGAVGIARAEKEPESLQRFMGMNIYTVKTFINEQGRDLDFMRMTVEIGEYYVENSMRASTGSVSPTDAYASVDTHFQIYDETRNRWYTIDPRFVLENCGVFRSEPDDDGVRSFDDQELDKKNLGHHQFDHTHLGNMALYYSLRLKNSQTPAPPGHHKDPHDEIISQFSEIDSQYKVFPAAYIGQIQNQHLGQNDLLLAAHAIRARLPNADAIGTALQRIATHVAALAGDTGLGMQDNELVEYFKGTLDQGGKPGSFMGDNKVTTDTIPKDNNAFYNLLVTENPDDKLFPYGYTSYYAAKTLTVQLTSDTVGYSPHALAIAEDLRKHVPVFEEFADSLLAVLGDKCVLVNPHYDRLNMSQRSHYSTLWSTLFNANQSAVFVRSNKSGGGGNITRLASLNLPAVRYDPGVLVQIKGAKYADDFADLFIETASITDTTTEGRLLAAIIRLILRQVAYAVLGLYTDDESATEHRITSEDTEKHKTAVASQFWIALIKGELESGIKRVQATAYDGAIKDLAGAAGRFARAWITSIKLYVRPDLEPVQALLDDRVQAVVTEYATLVIAPRGGDKQLSSEGVDNVTSKVYNRTSLLMGPVLAEQIMKRVAAAPGSIVDEPILPADPEIPEEPILAARVQDLYLSGMLTARKGNREMGIIGDYWANVHANAHAKADRSVLQYIGANAPAMRFLLSTPDFVQRYLDIRGVASILDRALLLGYLLTPLRCSVMKRLVDNNIPLPFRWMVTRPHMSYDTFSITIMKAGLDTMMVARRPGLFEFADTINTQTTQANYIACYGPVVKKEQNIRHINHVWPAGSNGGSGVVPYHPEHYNPGERVYTDVNGNENGGSVFVMLLSCTEAHDLPNPLDISGYFAMYNEMVDDRTIPENTRGPHYSLAPFYRMLLGFGVKGYEKFKKDSYRGPETQNNVPNGVCYAGYQQGYNRKTAAFTNVSEGTGHFGAGMTYIGCHLIRAGRVTRHTMPGKSSV